VARRQKKSRPWTPIFRNPQRMKKIFPSKASTLRKSPTLEIDVGLFLY
jgi:hypothetical protein